MNKGILYAAAAYGIWGFLPVLLKTLSSVPPFQITAHRAVWCFLFLLIIVVAGQGQLAALKAALTRRNLLVYTLTALLLSVNWLVFVWAVNGGFIVDSSLGYFINPLISVLLGMIFLRERLRPLQWLPVGLVAAGVIYLTFSHGGLPWIALVLALTFGSYGLVKKIAPLEALPGVAMETGIMSIAALAYLLFEEGLHTGAFGHAGLVTSLLLVGSGIASAVPLLLFTAGARRAPLSVVGLLQYISPTLQFLCGVYLYGETFDHTRLVGFSIIWLALLVFTAESLLVKRRTLASAAA
jgi:chloramphenicol-sensitive protein RarD